MSVPEPEINQQADEPNQEDDSSPSEHSSVFSLPSDPSTTDFFDNVSDQSNQAQMGDRTSSFASLSSLQSGTQESRQLMQIVRQLLDVTNKQSEQLQKIAAMAQETKDAQLEFMTTFRLSDHDVCKRCERLDTLNIDRERENTNIVQALVNLEEKLTQTQELQTKIEEVDSKVGGVTLEIKTMGSNFEEVVSLIKNRSSEELEMKEGLEAMSEQARAIFQQLEPRIPEKNAEPQTQTLAKQFDAMLYDVSETLEEHEQRLQKLSSELCKAEGTLGVQIKELVNVTKWETLNILRVITGRERANSTVEETDDLIHLKRAARRKFSVC